MNGPVLPVAWYRFRTTFRHRWSGYLALAVLIGLVGGVALGSLTAARRTYASYPNFLASTNPSDLLVVPQPNGPEPGLVHELGPAAARAQRRGGRADHRRDADPGRPDQHRPDNPGGADRQPGRAVLRPGPPEDHPGPGGQPGAGGRGRGHERGCRRPRPARGVAHPGRDRAGQRQERQRVPEDRADGGGDRRARHPARARRHRHEPGRVPGRHPRPAAGIRVLLRHQQLRRPAAGRRQPQRRSGRAGVRAAHRQPGRPATASSSSTTPRPSRPRRSRPSGPRPSPWPCSG